MIVKSSKLSDFKIKKLVWCFCVDVEASKVGLIVKLNRNTVNRFYHLFRTLVYYYQLEEFGRVITGEAECDEAYFGGKRLMRCSWEKRQGRVYFERILEFKDYWGKLPLV